MLSTYQARLQFRSHHVPHRSLDKKDTYAHILSMQGAKERLHLFQADLLGPSHAWSDALRGCTALMHVASSYRLDVACMQKEERCQLVETAVEGTRKVLEAAKEAGSVKKVGVAKGEALGPGSGG